MFLKLFLQPNPALNVSISSVCSLVFLILFNNLCSPKKHLSHSQNSWIYAEIYHYVTQMWTLFINKGNAVGIWSTWFLDPFPFFKIMHHLFVLVDICKGLCNTPLLQCSPMCQSYAIFEKESKKSPAILIFISLLLHLLKLHLAPKDFPDAQCRPPLFQLCVGSV